MAVGRAAFLVCARRVLFRGDAAGVERCATAAPVSVFMVSPIRKGAFERAFWLMSERSRSPRRSQAASQLASTMDAVEVVEHTNDSGDEVEPQKKRSKKDKPAMTTHAPGINHSVLEQFESIS
jgi:hypothetical protein